MLIGGRFIDVRLIVLMALLAIALLAALFMVLHTGTWQHVHQTLTAVPKIINRH
jgi:flagellar biosynthesis protein FliQ